MKATLFSTTGVSLLMPSVKRKKLWWFIQECYLLWNNMKTEGSNDHEKAVNVFCRALALEGLGKAKEAAEQYRSAVELYPLVEISAFRPPRSDL